VDAVARFTRAVVGDTDALILYPGDDFFFIAAAIATVALEDDDDDDDDDASFSARYALYSR
jgi:hypothetical protein